MFGLAGFPGAAVSSGQCSQPTGSWGSQEIFTGGKLANHEQAGREERTPQRIHEHGPV